MSYSYATQRPAIFTERGQLMFLRIRDAAKEMIKFSGAVTSGKLMSAYTGDVWDMLACMDRLVELGELREVTDQALVRGQDRVFVATPI